MFTPSVLLPGGKQVTPGTHRLNKANPLARGLVSAIVGGTDFTDGYTVQLTAGGAFRELGIDNRGNGGKPSTVASYSSGTGAVVAGVSTNSAAATAHAYLTNGQKYKDRLSVVNTLTIVVVADIYDYFGYGRAFSIATNGYGYPYEHIGFGNAGVNSDAPGAPWEFLYNNAGNPVRASSGNNFLSNPTSRGITDRANRSVGMYSVTRSGTALRFYRDGTFHSTGTLSASTNPTMATAENPTIGCRGWSNTSSSGDPIMGNYLAVFVWDRALSDAEMRTVSESWHTEIVAPKVMVPATLMPAAAGNASITVGAITSITTTAQPVGSAASVTIGGITSTVTTAQPATGAGVYATASATSTSSGLANNRTSAVGISGDSFPTYFTSGTQITIPMMYGDGSAGSSAGLSWGGTGFVTQNPTGWTMMDQAKRQMWGQVPDVMYTVCGFNDAYYHGPLWTDAQNSTSIVITAAAAWEAFNVARGTHMVWIIQPVNQFNVGNPEYWANIQPLLAWMRARGNGSTVSVIETFPYCPPLGYQADSVHPSATMGAAIAKMINNGVGPAVAKSSGTASATAGSDASITVSGFTSTTTTAQPSSIGGYARTVSGFTSTTTTATPSALGGYVATVSGFTSTTTTATPTPSYTNAGNASIILGGLNSSITASGVAGGVSGTAPAVTVTSTTATPTGSFVSAGNAVGTASPVTSTTTTASVIVATVNPASYTVAPLLSSVIISQPSGSDGLLPTFAVRNSGKRPRWSTSGYRRSSRS